MTTAESARWRWAEWLNVQDEPRRHAIRRISFVLVLLIPTTTAAVLAFHDIGVHPFWRDEAWSINVADRSIPATVEVLVNRREAYMTLYYLLLNGWLELGSSEGFVRILSAVFAVAAVPVTVAFARETFGLVAGAIAGAALALSSLLVVYAQEARSYGLVLLLAALSFLCFMHAIESERPRNWVLYTLATAAMVYSHMLSVLLVVAQLASLPLLPPARVQYRYAIRALAALALLCSPLLLAVFDDRGQATWIQPTDLDAVASVAGAYAGNRLLEVGYGIIFLVALGRLGAALRRSGRSREAWLNGLVVLWVALPPLLLIVLSLVKPLFLDRYLIGILPGLAVLAGATIATMRPPSLAVVAAALLVAAGVGDVATRDSSPSKSEDLQAAASLVLSRARAGDGVAYSPPWGRVGFAYYLDHLSPSGGAPPADLDMAPGGTPAREGDVLAKEAAPAAVARRIMRSKRVWLVGYPGIGSFDIAPDPVAEVGPVLFDRYFSRRGSWRFGDIKLTLYERRALVRVSSKPRIN
jgi:mannosyltransferase